MAGTRPVTALIPLNMQHLISLNPTGGNLGSIAALSLADYDKVTHSRTLRNLVSQIRQTKDRKKAFELFKKAAAQELADAEYAVGKAYFKGKGVASDKAQAKKWLLRAVRNEKGGTEIMADLRKDAAEGDEDAKAMLALIGKK